MTIWQDNRPDEVKKANEALTRMGHRWRQWMGQPAADQRSARRQQLASGCTVLSDRTSVFDYHNP